MSAPSPHIPSNQGRHPSRFPLPERKPAPPKPRSTTGQVVVSFGADDRAARPLRASSGCPTATEAGHTASKQVTAATKSGRHNPSRCPLGNPRHPSRPPPRPLPRVARAAPAQAVIPRDRRKGHRPLRSQPSSRACGLMPAPLCLRQRRRPTTNTTTVYSMSTTGKYTRCEVTASPVSLSGFSVQNHSQKTRRQAQPTRRKPRRPHGRTWGNLPPGSLGCVC